MTTVFVDRHRVNVRHLSMTLVITAIVAWMLWESRSFPARVGLFPMVITSTVLVLCVIDLVRILSPSFIGRRRVNSPTSNTEEVAGPHGDWQDPDDGEQERATTTGKAIGWLFVLIVPTLLVGFLIAAPLYMALFLRVVGQYSWFTIGLMIAGTLLVLYVGFVEFLGLPIYGGILG